MIGKSKKNIDVEKFVDKHIAKNGVPPTYVMIQHEFDIGRCAAYARCEKFRDKMRRCNNVTKYKIGGVSVKLSHPIAKHKIEEFIAMLSKMNTLFIS